MKRTKLLSILALLLIVVLISLSFIKLPISTLTNERIQSETQGYVSFHGAEAQSLLLLPTPKIELLDSFFSITHPSIKLDIFSSYTELSKSLFNDDVVLEGQNLLTLLGLLDVAQSHISEFKQKLNKDGKL